jgi:hypothetical protein
MEHFKCTFSLICIQISFIDIFQNNLQIIIIIDCYIEFGLLFLTNETIQKLFPKS